MTATARSRGRGIPRCSARPVGEGWPEVADFNATVICRVMDGGTLAYRDQELTLRRNGGRRAGLAGPRLFADRDDAGRPCRRHRPSSVETTDKVRTTGRWLAGERERLTQMFEQAPSFMAMLRGPDHVFELANAAYLQLIGHRDVLGKPIREALPDLAGQGLLRAARPGLHHRRALRRERRTVLLERTPGARAGRALRRFRLSAGARRSGEDRSASSSQGIDITERHARRSARCARARRSSASSPRRCRTTSGRRRRRVRSTGSTSGSTNTPARCRRSLSAEAGPPICTPTTVPRRCVAGAGRSRSGEPATRPSSASGGRRRLPLAHRAGGRRSATKAGVHRCAGSAPTPTSRTRPHRAGAAHSELRLRLSQAAAGIASLEVDVPTGRVFGSDTLWALWGLPPRRERPRSPCSRNMVIPEDRHIRSNPQTRREGRRGAERRVPHPPRPTPARCAGLSRHVEFVRDAAGKPVKMFGVMRDVTDAEGGRGAPAAAHPRARASDQEHPRHGLGDRLADPARRRHRDRASGAEPTVAGARGGARHAEPDAMDLGLASRGDHGSDRALSDRPDRGGRSGLRDRPDAGRSRWRWRSTSSGRTRSSTARFRPMPARVTIGWRLERQEGAPMLVWHWRERGGPPVTPPERRGFGRFLLERVLAADFGGTVRIDFRPEGVVCLLSAPWAPLQDRSKSEDER